MISGGYVVESLRFSCVVQLAGRAVGEFPWWAVVVPGRRVAEKPGKSMFF
jgi:hypothetical protein